MTEWLPNTPRPKPRETLPSFFSRLAVSKGVTTRDFAYDMGVPFKEMQKLGAESLARIVRWGRLSPGDLQELLSWTGESIGNVRMRFRNEVFVSRALRNPTVRGCPNCLREDAEQASGNPLEQMFMRGNWQMREATACIRHGHLLVELWQAHKVSDRCDIGQRLTEILPAVLGGELDGPELKTSPYDLWLDQRLDDGRDETWLAAHSLYATTTFCRLLGASVLGMSIADLNSDPFKLRAAQDEGFRVACQGEDHIRAVLDTIASRADGSQDFPQKAFGQLFVKLSRDYADENVFVPFRHMLRDCILAHWPIATGEVVLGEILQQRRVHSLATAAVETGVGVKLLKQFLEEAGAFEPAEKGETSRMTFDAVRYSSLLAEIPTLVGPIAMQDAMGATKTELKSLERGGVLSPRARSAKINSPWRISDGVNLVGELRARAECSVGNDNAWESIQRASARSRLTVGEIIKAIRSATLVVAVEKDVDGYTGIRVRRDEIDALASAMSTNRSRKWMGPKPGIPLAAFARSIGLREKGQFAGFVKAGHGSVTKSRNPANGKIELRMTEDDVAAFHKTFMTITTMAEESGLHRNTVRTLLKHGNVSPITYEGRTFQQVWRRDDVERLLKSGSR